MTRPWSKIGRKGLRRAPRQAEVLPMAIIDESEWESTTATDLRVFALVGCFNSVSTVPPKWIALCIC